MSILQIFRDAMYDADGRPDILEAVLDYLDDSIVLPPGEWDKKTLLPIINIAKQKKKKQKAPKTEEETSAQLLADEEATALDPLHRTKRPFGGLINDIKRRYPKYISDLKDGLNVQCFATILFIYFAALSPAITFGGLLSKSSISPILYRNPKENTFTYFINGHHLLRSIHVHA